LYWLLPAGNTRRRLGDRIQNLVAVTTAYTVNSPYCIADTVESQPTGLSEAELDRPQRTALRGVGRAAIGPRTSGLGSAG